MLSISLSYPASRYFYQGVVIGWLDCSGEKGEEGGSTFQAALQGGEARIKHLRAREDAKRQEEYLNQAYYDRLAGNTEEEEGDDAKWDPIEDVLGDERGTYMDLIRHFLWHEIPQASPDSLLGTFPPTTLVPQAISQVLDVGHQLIATHAFVTNDENSSAPKDKQVPVSTKRTKKANAAQSKTLPAPGEAHIESKAELRKRLTEGVQLMPGTGILMKGTQRDPIEISTRTRPWPEEEIDVLIKEIVEVKNLLLCRLLLGHPTLLPVALRVDSIEDLLQDSSITSQDLRDLCLKIEHPDLQALRDACADLGRAEDEIIEDNLGNESDDESADEGCPKSSSEDIVPSKTGPIPERWVSMREQQAMDDKYKIMTGDDGLGSTYVDFGRIDDQVQYQVKKIRVKVCGRYIYNYPSEKAMRRGGWLHFSIIAKDSTLFESMRLCRSWDEFFELNILASFMYFPVSNWALWIGGAMRQQQLELVSDLSSGWPCADN